MKTPILPTQFHDAAWPEFDGRWYVWFVTERQQFPIEAKVKRSGGHVVSTGGYYYDGVDYWAGREQLTGICKDTGERSAIVKVETPTQEQLQSWFDSHAVKSVRHTVTGL